MWYVWEGGEVRTRFWWEILKGKGHLRDPRVGEGVILKWIFSKLGGDVHWIRLAQDGDERWTLADVAMNLRIKTRLMFWLA